jgi:molybdenum cofactor cytidylyltransferase
MTRSAAPVGVACIVLAAGGSRRLGLAKQLVRRRARTLLAHALEAASTALPASSLIVVVGAEALRLRAVVRRAVPHAISVSNSRWSEGLATSLKAGLAAVPTRATAILVMLVDQPNVDSRALLKLLAAWRRRPGLPAAAHYAGHPGVPAVLPRRYFKAVRSLRGDQGARALLRGASALTLVAMPEAALDIDTPADLAQLGS